jgi:predicted secreted protein
MRLFAAIAIFAATQFCAVSARAGDTAELNILGFTADGGVFAFEEFGIQDGSGIPYAHRFYIDTATDSFLPGTPIRVRIDDETASLEDARSQARSQGEAIAAQAELEANRGLTAGSNPSPYGGQSARCLPGCRHGAGITYRGVSA